MCCLWVGKLLSARLLEGPQCLGGLRLPERVIPEMVLEAVMSFMTLPRKLHIVQFCSNLILVT